MSRYDAFHELYEECHDLEFNETSELMQKAVSDDERNFIVVVTDYILQQKQKKVIAEKKF